MRQLDTRSWNLFAGVAGLGLLVGACGGRTIAAEGEAGSEDNSGESAESTTETTETTQEGGACQSDADCPPSYYCIDAVCEYVPVADGGHWYECFDDASCGALQLCVNEYCEDQSVPASCAEAPPLPIPLPMPEVALGLSFANVDGVLGQELVVVSEQQLHVFDVNGVETSVAQRESEGPIIAAAAGSLVGIPGDDVVLLQMVNEEISRVVHPGDGMGGFGPEEPLPVNVPAPTDLAVIDLGGAFESTLVWGPEGAELLGELELPLSAEAVTATTHRQSNFLGMRGASLLGRNQLRFYDYDFELQGALDFDDFGGTGSLASMRSMDDSFDIASRRINQWTLLATYSVAPPSLESTVGVSLSVADLAVGDLRGDQGEDLALRTLEGELWIYRDIGDQAEQCLTAVELPGVLVEMVVGDHDGDGDEELALRFEDGSVALFDDEG